MGIISGIVVYILIWWVVIFCVLPLKIKTLEKNTDGSMPGAPVNPEMKFKVILTSVISVAIWVVVYLLITSGIVSYHEIAQHMAM